MHVVEGYQSVSRAKTTNSDGSQQPSGMPERWTDEWLAAILTCGSWPDVKPNLKAVLCANVPFPLTAWGQDTGNTLRTTHWEQVERERRHLSGLCRGRLSLWSGSGAVW